MKRYFVLLCAVLTMMLLPTSCLKGSDDNGATVFNDMGVTYFYIGTMKRYVPTETGGTKRTTVDGSTYNFQIDQQQRRIFNTDSLPVGTDITKVPCTITAYNNGGLYLEDLEDKDVLQIYSSTDSIDFSVPRKLRVYAYGTANYSTYTITLNVHKEDGDVFRWTKMTAGDVLKDLTAVRLMTMGEKLVLVGRKGNATVFFSSEDGKSWQQRFTTVNMALSADACVNTLCFGDYLYTLSNGELLRSDDLEQWETIYAATGNESLRRLVAAGTTEMYAYGDIGEILVSQDGGYTWEWELLDTSPDLLPTEDVAYVCHQYSTLKMTDYVLLAGSRSAAKFPQDKAAQVWHKIVDYSETGVPSWWAYMEWAENNTNKYLPCLEGLSLLRYDDRLLGIGLYEGMLSVFESHDGGLVWQESSYYTLPTDMDQGLPVSVCTDEDNFIWLAQATTGQIWRGRLNKMGWE